MLKDSFGSLQKYIELQLKYNKLLLTQKMSEIFSLIILFVIILGLGGFVLIFFSLAFVNWYSENVGMMFHGFLWVTLFYLVIAILIYLLRKPFIFDPLRIIFGNILFREESINGEDVPFKTKEELRSNIAGCKVELHNETEELKTKLEALSEKLTLPNILLNVGKSLYQSYITTSNIVKVSALLASKIFSKKKERRKDEEDED
ncbi:MAG TPA: phage holin family protein [Bacteroidales bacterium]